MHFNGVPRRRVDFCLNIPHYYPNAAINITFGTKRYTFMM